MTMMGWKGSVSALLWHAFMQARDDWQRAADFEAYPNWGMQVGFRNRLA